MRRLVVAALLVAACTTDAAGPAPSLTFDIVSGNGQSGVVGQPLPSPLVVKAVDAKGKPIRNLAVSFVVTSGGGTASPASAVTDQQGRAQTTWTLGTSVAQAQRLEGRVTSNGSVLGAFTATPLPGPAAHVVIQAGDGQSAIHDTPVPVRPAVVVRDQYGNPVSAVSVTFAVTGGGGSVTGSPVTTLQDGSAVAGSWTLGHTPGPNALRASISGAAPVTFNATALPGSPTRMTLQAGNNQTAVVNTTLPIAPAVRITDSDGNAVPGVRVNFTVLSGGSVVFPDTMSTQADGVAAALAWFLHWRAGPTTLRATVNGVADTVVFTATGVHGAISSTHSGVSVSPITINASTGSSSATVTGYAKDGFGNPIAGATIVFTATGTGNSFVQPTQPTDTAGQAVGHYSATGSGSKRIGGTADGVAMFTAPITVNPGPAATIAKIQGDDQTGLTGEPLAVLIAVIARDTYGNPVPNHDIRFTAYGDEVYCCPVTNDTGLAFTQWKLGASAGPRQLYATSLLLNQSVVFNATGHSQAASIEIEQGDGQTAAVGTAVAIAPRVLVRDAAGQPVAGAFIEWAIPQGGGSVQLPYPYNGWLPQRSDANGLASVWTWTMGPYAGVNALVARVPGTNLSVTFAATATGSAWTRRADIPTRRFLHGVAELDGLIYAAGGEDMTEIAALDVYDPTTDQWSARAPMPTARYGPAVAATGGRLYVAGGIVGTTVLGTLEVYDPSSDSWTTRASMPTPREGAAVAVVNGLVYVIGGGACLGDPCSWQETNVVEAYDPATDTWTTRSSLPTARQGTFGAVVNGVIYVIGGQLANVTSSWMSTVEAYDPTTDTWMTRAPMPTPREGAAVGILNGLIHVVGGNGAGYNSLATHEAYDPVTNSWTTKESMPTPRGWLAAAAANGIMFVIGGGNVPGMEMVEAYTP